jgi:hypothetical protein
MWNKQETQSSIILFSIHQQMFLLLVPKDVIVVVHVTNIYDDTNIPNCYFFNLNYKQ